MGAFRKRMAEMFFFVVLVMGAARAYAVFPRMPLAWWIPGTDEVEVDWTSIDQAVTVAMQSQGVCGPWRNRLTIDGERLFDVPAGHTTWRLKLVVGEQHDIVVEFRDANGKLVHRSDPGLLEVHTAQTIERDSFRNMPLLSIHLPRSQAATYGLDNDLARLAVDISHEKVAWTLRKDADPRLRSVPPHLLDITVDFDGVGKPVAVRAIDTEHGNAWHPALSNFFIKVDAAFNGDSFFWDDMFVSLETAWHQPPLVESTLDFWYAIQDENGAGVIPREVRKSNRLSFNPPQSFVFGKERENGAYTNPNLSGWVEWELYSLRSPQFGSRRLPSAIHSLEAYLDWLHAKRAVAGIPDGLWQDNLGSGMDNLPRGGGDDNPEGNSHTVWIDLMAQQAAMYRSLARMHAALGHWKDSAGDEARAEGLAAYLNANHWSEAEGFYFDRIPDGPNQLKLDVATPTIAGFWPLWSGSAPATRTDQVVRHQLIPGHFGDEFPLPALSASHPLYSDQGHYWLGGRWPSTATMVIQAFQNSARPDVSLDLTRKFLHAMSQVSDQYAITHPRGTVFEFYGVQRLANGTLAARPGMEPGHMTRSDFAGWAAVPPVYNNLRHWFGLRPVPGFAGPASERGRWLDALVQSPLFANSNYLAFNPFLKLAPQKGRAESGYLEWNLMFDPGSRPGSEPEPGPGTRRDRDEMEIENIVYHGSRIEKLAVRSISLDRYQISVKSDRVFPLQVNRLYDGTRISTVPMSASPIENVGGDPVVEQNFNFQLAAANSSEVG